MGIFLSVGVCVLDIMLVIFIITFLFDALKSNWWKVFMIVFILVLLLNAWGLLFF